MRFTLAWITLIAVGLNAEGVAAQQLSESALDKNDIREALAHRGVELSISLTQFYQGLVAGDGDKNWQYGGKGDVIVKLDGEKLGLWPGLSLLVNQEWVYGEDVNTLDDGTTIPVNTAMAFPRLGGHDQDTSFVLTQAFGERFSISLGKFNMIDSAAKTPLLGGGGLETFFHLGLAAPISGVTPPYLLGVSAALNTEPVNFLLLVYDPRNAQDWEIFEDPYAEGTTSSLWATVPVRIGGRTGYQVVRGVYSTKKGLDLASIPQLRLPPQSTEILTKEGYWFVSYAFQQYLFQDSVDAQKGWGIFGQVALSDGNPNPVQSSVLFGVGGNSFIPNRIDDRWGVGYFRYNASEDLLDGLSALGLKRRDEQGVEVYYDLAVKDWLRLTADVIYTRPANATKNNAVFLGVRARTILW